MSELPVEIWLTILERISSKLPSGYNMMFDDDERYKEDFKVLSNLYACFPWVLRLSPLMAG
jgi:hypothetical protein